MNEEPEEFCVVRNEFHGFVFSCSRQTWDEWFADNMTKNLTLLADKLTREQAKQYVKLTKEPK